MPTAITMERPRNTDRGLVVTKLRDKTITGNKILVSPGKSLSPNKRNMRGALGLPGGKVPQPGLDLTPNLP
jgi:hypothetical protein